METSGSGEQVRSPVARHRRWLRWPVGVSTLVIGVVALGHYFVSELEDAVGLGLDLVNVVRIAGLALLILVWSGWAIFFSHWRWSVRLLVASSIVASPLIAYLILGPVFGGDLDLLRLEPIWARRATFQPLDDLPGTRADLSVEAEIDFPRFLGPRGDATVDFAIDAEAFQASRILWRQPIGSGWSSFVARGGFAVTMEQRAEFECVSCYDIESGDLVWLYQHPARHCDALNLGHVGPRSTPAIDDGMVFAMGAVGNLVCLDGADGTVRWQVDLNERLGIELTQQIGSDGLSTQYEANSSLAWGRAGSPLVVDDVVIVPGGGPREGSKSTLLAFDCKTGTLQWRGGDQMIGYGSPTIATVAGVRQVLLTAESKAMGFDPTDGTVLWQHDRSGQSDSAANTSQISAISGTDLLTSKGYPDGGGQRLRLTADEQGALSVEMVWESSRVMRTKLTSPVVHDGYAYAISNGFLECTDLRDGERLWKHRGRFGHGQLLRVGGFILLHAESGTLYLVEASPERYIERGSMKTIDGICWNNLCLYGNRLLLRSDLEAACVELIEKQNMAIGDEGT